MITEPREGDLRLWWIPQVPGKPFYVEVASEAEAILVYDTLTRYDEFQYENFIKPDYSNAGGLEFYYGGEWCEWYNEDGYDLSDIMRERWTNDE